MIDAENITQQVKRPQMFNLRPGEEDVELTCSAQHWWCCSVVMVANHAMAEVKDLNTSDRKIITRVEPDYPETLKRLYIGGVVRIEVVVGPSGKIESTQPWGGNPISGQSTM